jgi:hypothetical protein
MSTENPECLVNHGELEPYKKHQIQIVDIVNRDDSLKIYNSHQTISRLFIETSWLSSLSSRSKYSSNVVPLPQAANVRIRDSIICALLAGNREREDNGTAVILWIVDRIVVFKLSIFGLEL